MKTGSRVLVTQIKGLSGRTLEVHETLRALGLGRIGKKREVTVNPSVWGMLRRVRHMIQVIEVK